MKKDIEIMLRAKMPKFPLTSRLINQAFPELPEELIEIIIGFLKPKEPCIPIRNFFHDTEFFLERSHFDGNFVIACVLILKYYCRSCYKSPASPIKTSMKFQDGRLEIWLRSTSSLMTNDYCGKCEKYRWHFYYCVLPYLNKDLHILK